MSLINLLAWLLYYYDSTHCLTTLHQNLIQTADSAESIVKQQSHAVLNFLLHLNKKNNTPK